MKLFAFLTACAVALSFAASADTRVGGFTGGGAADVLGQTTTPRFISSESNAGLKLTASCTDLGGRVYTSSDEGYQDCLRNAANRPHPGGVPGQTASPNVGFSYGSK